MSTPDGQVFDLGYRHYRGAREGRSRARKALVVNGVRTCLGLGRGGRAKILPVLFLAAMVAPALVLAAIAGLLGPLAEQIRPPGPQDYYRIVSPILLTFAAIIAPELLCADRRDGVLSLYLVRPLSPADYVIGRWLAFFVVSLTYIYAGQALLLAGLLLDAGAPIDYLQDRWRDIPRWLAAGLLIAVVTTTVPLAAASLTTRRAYATLSVIGLFFVSSSVAGLLATEQCVTTPPAAPGASPVMECRPHLRTIGPLVRLIDFGRTPSLISDWVFGVYDDREQSVQQEAAQIAMDGEQITVWLARPPIATAIASWVLVVAAPAFILWRRYRRPAA